MKKLNKTNFSNPKKSRFIILARSKKLINLNNEYVIFYVESIKSKKDFDYKLYGKIINTVQDHYVFQFNPLIQNKINEDLGLLIDSGIDESIITNRIFENFMENYPPTFEFGFHAADIDMIDGIEIFMHPCDIMSLVKKIT